MVVLTTNKLWSEGLYELSLPLFFFLLFFSVPKQHFFSYPLNFEETKSMETHPNLKPKPKEEETTQWRNRLQGLIQMLLGLSSVKFLVPIAKKVYLSIYLSKIFATNYEESVSIYLSVCIYMDFVCFLLGKPFFFPFFF